MAAKKKLDDVSVEINKIGQLLYEIHSRPPAPGDALIMSEIERRKDALLKKTGMSRTTLEERLSRK